ncbi:MAG: acetoacetate--CoA ligase [Acidobacteriota bacterium]
MPDRNGPLWTPSPERIARANMTRFIRFVRNGPAPGVNDYASLYHWSIASPELFWPAIWDFCGIRAEQHGASVLEEPDRMPGARWFSGARLNFAENLLRFADQRPAISFRAEDGTRRRLTYRELHEEVSGLARALRETGLRPGDRVASFMPNIPETLIAMLAVTSLGATWSSCSPDFGLSGVADRFEQIRPKILFTADGYRYNGKRYDSLERVRGLADRLPDLEKIIVVPYLDHQPDISRIRSAVASTAFAARSSDAIDFAPLPFDHPVYILFSSGTTGVPKCIVHGAGGTLIQHLKELVLHTDLRREDTIFYFTTCGWMMWNWLASSLAVGATVQLYDGSPMHPDPGTLWRMAAEEGVTIFGTSAGYLAAQEKAGVRPGREYDLAALRAVLSTGSPLAPEGFDFVYRDIKRDVQLSSISGGTDIISCFGLGNPIGPVYRGEIQTRGLGMKVAVLDDAGRPLRGVKGELCCLAPFPSMPVGFFDDPGGRRYHAAYFERFEDTWAHGDYAELTDHDGLIIYGRSDATLNPGGVRIGTAEIYRVVEKIPEVLECMAIGQAWAESTRIILFVVLKTGCRLDDTLRETIRRRLRTEASPRHVPAKILQIEEVPRTISGKIVELAVTDVIHGRPVKNRDALARPEALDQFRDLPQLREP